MTAERTGYNSPQNRDLRLRADWGLETSGLLEDIDFPGKPDKELVAELAFRDDQNLGTSVAKVIIEEANGMVASVNSLTARVGFWGNLRLSVILNSYARVARDFLIAQEIVRTGEVPKDFFSGDDAEELEQTMSSLHNVIESLLNYKLEEGKPVGLDGWKDAETIEDIRRDVFHKQLEFVLRRSDDPLEFIDQVAQYYFHIPYPPGEEDNGPRVMRALKDNYLKMGRDRFHDLYNAAMRARGKALGMSPEELHKDWWEQQKRKGRRLT